MLSNDTATEEVDVSDMNGYMGVVSTGETVYYAESEKESAAVMVFYDPESNQYVSFVGEVTSPSDTQIEITDIESSLSITFEVTAAEGDQVRFLLPLRPARLPACGAPLVFRAQSATSHARRPQATTVAETGWQPIWGPPRSPRDDTDFPTHRKRSFEHAVSAHDLHPQTGLPLRCLTVAEVTDRPPTSHHPGTHAAGHAPGG